LPVLRGLGPLAHESLQDRLRSMGEREP